LILVSSVILINLTIMSLIFSNLVPIFLIVVIVIVLLNKFKKGKDADVKRNIHQQKQQEAQTVGIQVANQAAGHVSNSGEIHGDTNYNGTTGGVDWALASTVLVGDRNVGAGGRNQVWKRKSVWKTQAVKLPAGKFIMIMSTPGEIKLGAIKRGGFINDLVNKAADAVLDLYVGGYFGSEYKSLVSIGEDGVKIERDQLKDFMILTNDEPLAQKYFDDATASTISYWKKNSMGFTEENKVDQFGLLFSPDGVILTCQTSMNNANEVKAFSDFGAALVIKMQQVKG
jgi:hypothetical protein